MWIGKNNHEFGKLLDSISHIPLRDQTVSLTEPIDVRNLFPSNYNVFAHSSGNHEQLTNEFNYN